MSAHLRAVWILLHSALVTSTATGGLITNTPITACFTSVHGAKGNNWFIRRYTELFLLCRILNAGQPQQLIMQLATRLKGRTNLHTLLWNNKLDELWALMKPNQYQITNLSNTERVMGHGGDVCFCTTKDSLPSTSLIKGQLWVIVSHNPLTKWLQHVSCRWVWIFTEAPPQIKMKSHPQSCFKCVSHDILNHVSLIFTRSNTLAATRAPLQPPGSTGSSVTRFKMFHSYCLMLKH